MTSTQKKPRAARRRRKTTPKPMTSESYPVTLDKEDEPSTPDIAISHEVIQAVAKKAVLPVTLPKPTDNIIPLSSYIKDAQNRWKIHQYEIKALSKDIRWAYNKAEPFVKKVVARFSPKGS